MNVRTVGKTLSCIKKDLKRKFETTLLDVNNAKAKIVNQFG
jgi:hypothetical protein